MKQTLKRQRGREHSLCTLLANIFHTWRGENLVVDRAAVKYGGSRVCYAVEDLGNVGGEKAPADYRFSGCREKGGAVSNKS